MESASASARLRAARRVPAWVSGLLPLVVLGAGIALFVALNAPGLERRGVPVEELAVERTVLRPGEIELHVTNDGPDPVRVEQVIVNDGFAAFTQSDSEVGRLGGDVITVQYPWVEGESYEISLLTATGAAIDTSVEGATETPAADAGFYGLMALIGLYVGVIPVTIGMLWLPWVRRIDRRWIRFLLAVTAGLLLWLAIDAVLEGVEFAGGGAQAFGGPALVFLGAAAAYAALAGVDAFARGRRGAREVGVATAPVPGVGGLRLAFVVALGIGLHNLGEGLAIGAAFALGEVALGVFLILGFTLHNVTEGVGIAAPVVGANPGLKHFALLALVAGGPAILGTWIGAFVYSPFWTTVFLAVGIGAILQVIVEVGRLIWRSQQRHGEPALSWTTLGGVTAGIAVMYLTALLVAA